MTTSAESLPQAIRLHQAGQLAQAEQLYRQILAAEPQQATAMHLLGLIAHQAGRHDAAIQLMTQAMTLDATQPSFHNNLGSAYRTSGQFAAAEAAYRQAIQLNPAFQPAYHNLGLLLQSAGQLAEAQQHYEQALRLQPNHAEVHNQLGGLFKAQNKLIEAVAEYREALRCRPQYAEAASNLGAVLVDLKRADEAVELLQYALKLQPDSAIAHFNLGNAHLARNQWQDAAASFREAVRIKPDFVEALFNLGAIFQQHDKVAEAAECFQRALRIKPEVGIVALCESAEARNRSGAIHREQGRLTEAGVPAQPFAEPRWDGGPLGDRTLLVYAEFGLGDTMQFIRYCPLIQQREPCAQVLIEVPSRMIPLLRLAGFHGLVAQGTTVGHFDLQVPLLSLPGVFRTTIDTIPASIPYLTADSELVHEWQERLASIGGFRIGINWQGHANYDLHRSIPLACFEPLARVPGVSLISLQKNAGLDEIPSLDERFTVHDLGSDVDTARGAFMDTAAIMRNLDLVISSDTSIVHLAGALGVPVWVGLSTCSDWRWLVDRDDSPWYPTMRMFRQVRLDEWSPLFDRMAAELPGLIAAHQRQRCGS